jgi:hypothetical protein
MVLPPGEQVNMKIYINHIPNTTVNHNTSIMAAAESNACE